jgi:hypothetical protein
VTSLDRSVAGPDADPQYAVYGITFRDYDRVWYRVDETGFNKVGYLTRRNSVIYPRWNRGLVERPLRRVERYPHALFGRVAETLAQADNVEAFFTQNLPSIELFNLGMQALANRSDLSFFESPIRIPVLDDINSAEFERRWELLSSTVRAGDIVAVLDTRSVISKLIARFDHGTWNHVGTYSGERMLLEATTAGVGENDIVKYRDPRYRLGIYRHKNITDEMAGSAVGFMRSQVGRRYNFHGVIRLAILKVLGLQSGGNPRDVSPNDMARSERLKLVCIV